MYASIAEDVMFFAASITVSGFLMFMAYNCKLVKTIQDFLPQEQVYSVSKNI